MDKVGGTLGFAGLEIIRLVETDGSKKRVQNTIIPSMSALKWAAANVEKIGH